MNPAQDRMSTGHSYHRYSQWLIIPVALLIMSLSIGSFFFQPYWGPLTRLGGYLENDYGWNAPQQMFDTPLFKMANSIKEYDRYYDVVVFGDSFSYDGKRGWQNYFVEKTGLSVITLSHAMGVERIVNTKTFRSNPPRYLVFESLEQFTLARLQKSKSLPVLHKISGEHPQEGASSEDGRYETALPRLVERGVSPPLGKNTVNTTEERIGQLVDYAMKALARRFTVEPTADELRLQWGTNLENKTFNLYIRDNAPPLFSSRLNESLLVYSLDITKATDEAAVKQAAVGAWQMKRAVEANGRTRVLTMIFPDKLTIYAPYLADPSVAPPSVIPPLANEYPHQVRLDEVFAKAVADGVQDLYLPNDTHCGYKGYQLAAEQLALAIAQDKRQLMQVNSRYPLGVFLFSANMAVLD